MDLVVSRLSILTRGLNDVLRTAARLKLCACVCAQRLRERHAPALRPHARAERGNETFTLLSTIGLLIAVGTEGATRLLALGAVGIAYWYRSRG